MIACVIKIIALSLHPLKGKRPLAQGEVAEWSIAAVLKTVVLRGTGGSNPSLSAERSGQNQTITVQKPTSQQLVGFFCIQSVRHKRHEKAPKRHKFVPKSLPIPFRTKTVTICPKLTSRCPNLYSLYISHN